MIEKGMRPETAIEKKELNFEQGLKLIVDKINLLLSSQEYVLVAIAGPIRDTQVGKTTLASNIVSECISLNIPAIIMSEVDSLAGAKLPLELIQNSLSSSKGVIILQAEYSPSGFKQKDELNLLRNRQDSKVKEAAKQAGLPLSKVDLRVFIYRADRKIFEGDRMFADIIINNQHAKDRK